MKRPCPKCKSMMPYIPGRGWICLNCGNTNPYEKKRDFSDGKI